MTTLPFDENDTPAGMERWPGEPVSNADGPLDKGIPPTPADDKSEATTGQQCETGALRPTSGMFDGLFPPTPAGYLEPLTGDDALIVVDYQAEVIDILKSRIASMETIVRMRDERIKKLEENLDRERRLANANRGAFVSLTQEVDESVVVINGKHMTLRTVLDSGLCRELCRNCKDAECEGCDRSGGFDA